MSKYGAGIRKFLSVLLVMAMLSVSLPLAGLAEDIAALDAEAADVWSEPADAEVPEVDSFMLGGPEAAMPSQSLTEEAPEAPAEEWQSFETDEEGTEVYAVEAPSMEIGEATMAELDEDTYEVSAFEDVYKNGLFFDPVYGWQLYIDNQFAYYYTGLYCDANLGWWLIGGGTIAFGYTGLWCDAQYGWWLVNGGRVAFEYTGLWCDGQYGWWLVSGGTIAFNYTGLWCDPNVGWWLISGGTIAFYYTGLWCDPQYGWWKINGGTIDFGYSGLYCDPQCGWWLINGGTIAFEYTGLYLDANVGWWLIAGGQIAFFYNGLWQDPNLGWWKINGGTIDFGYTGMWFENDLWWLISGGTIASGYNGLWFDPNMGWLMISNGSINYYYVGIVNNGFGEWFVSGGTIDFTFNGMFKDETLGWVVVQNGQRVYDFTGILRNEYGAWYFKNSQMVELYTGPAKEGDVWRYMKKGLIDTEFTGLADIDGGKAYFKDGLVDYSFKGVAREPVATNDPKTWYVNTWYVENGFVNTKYTGAFLDKGISYEVVNGKATAKSSENPMLGVFFDSREDTSDSMYLSFDGYMFYDIGDAYTNVPGSVEEDNTATVSPSLNPDSPFKDWTVNTLHDPCIFYKDGVFWMVGGMVKGTDFYPMFGYSTDLVNWSFPSAGKNYKSKGLTPTTVPKDANGNRTFVSNYDAVAADAFVDDDGTVWLTVALGEYTDNHSNQLDQYIVKVTGLKAPADSSMLTTEQGKVEYSDFDVTYGSLDLIKLPPLNDTTAERTWSYDYDGSLFKQNGKYYLVVQHSGEEVQLWEIGSLNNASDPSAWKLVNNKMYEGSEGPCVTYNNGRYYLYTDRFAGWGFEDGWGEDVAGIFANTAETLTEPFSERARITDSTGKNLKARHGTVITLTDPNAKTVALNVWKNMTK